MQDNPSHLHLKSVEICFEKEAVVENFSFSLSEGEIGSLLGPSGCGKTSLLRAIAGFIAVSKGNISLNDKEISSPQFTLRPEQRNIGMIFQDYALFPHLSVLDNVSFGLKDKKKIKQQKALELLEQVGLRQQAERYPHELSGGQQQRVAIARALAPNPDILLMDEPFSNLDTDLRKRLSLQVRELLKKNGTTAILVTHDQQEAFAVADKIAVINSGKLQQWDTPFNLYHKPANRFVSTFVADGQFIPGVVVDEHSIKTEAGVLKTQMNTHWQKGDRLDILIRPRDIRYNPQSPHKMEIISKTFTGSNIIYTLKLSKEHNLEAHFDSSLNFNIGDIISVSIDIPFLTTFELVD